LRRVINTSIRFKYYLDVDSRDFKDFMSNVPNCVSIVSASYGDAFQACTVSSFISIDVEVPKTLIVLRNESRTLSTIKQSKFYSVSLLSQAQNEIANYFSSKTTQLNTHLDSLFVKNSKYMSPSLKKCLQVCFCKLESVIELENASLIIGTVLGVDSQAKEMPLIYWSRMYYSLGTPSQANS
jgi:flavin reductase (DIM6/NTAB) family NADH-FMN oxidoreductase RutF